MQERAYLQFNNYDQLTKGSAVSSFAHFLRLKAPPGTSSSEGTPSCKTRIECHECRVSVDNSFQSGPESILLRPCLGTVFSF